MKVEGGEAAKSPRGGGGALREERGGAVVKNPHNGAVCLLPLPIFIWGKNSSHVTV